MTSKRSLGTWPKQAGVAGVALGSARSRRSVPPFSALRTLDEEGAHALSWAYAPQFLWSWGESNPRPSAGERTCYDHSRHRGCRCLTGGSAAHRGGPRSVFPVCQRSFSPSAVFLAVILRFWCRAAMEWPRAAFLLTMTLRSPENQAARANCSSAILWMPRLASLSNSGRKLEQRY